jgi:signal-transduction protein with cAMP-binding, CBS, and nucleotidyltransferase domain
MRTIGEILDRKAKRGTVTISAGDSVLEAVRQMDQANTGSVVVLDGNRVAGIFSERDLMRRVVLKGLDEATTRVSQVMTTSLIYAEPGDPAQEAMAKMTKHRCRHLPVVEGERLIGVISIGDLMKEFSDEQTVEIEFLKQYIYSG